MKKIWFTQKCKQQKSWSNKNHCHKFRIYWISSTPSITSNAVANTQNSCYLLYFLHKLKLSLVKNNCWWLRYRWQIWSYRITTLSERDLTFSSGSISLSRIYIVQKDRFFYIGELWYIDTKSGDEESILFFFFAQKLSTLLSLIIVLLVNGDERGLRVSGDSVENYWSIFNM